MHFTAVEVSIRKLFTAQTVLNYSTWTNHELSTVSDEEAFINSQRYQKQNNRFVLTVNSILAFELYFSNLMLHAYVTTAFSFSNSSKPDFLSVNLLCMRISADWNYSVLWLCDNMPGLCFVFNRVFTLLIEIFYVSWKSCLRAFVQIYQSIFLISLIVDLLKSLALHIVTQVSLFVTFSEKTFVVL